MQLSERWALTNKSKTLTKHFEGLQCIGKTSLSSSQLVRINFSDFALKYLAPTHLFPWIYFFNNRVFGGIIWHLSIWLNSFTVMQDLLAFNKAGVEACLFQSNLLTSRVLPLPRCSAEPHLFTWIASVMTGLHRRMQLLSLSVQLQGLSFLTFAFPLSRTLDYPSSSGRPALAGGAGVEETRTTVTLHVSPNR